MKICDSLCVASLSNDKLHGQVNENFQQLSAVNIMLAAEIADMLSADMQKEGLSGRTLTLKLKTASFEVLSDNLYSNFVPIHI